MTASEAEESTRGGTASRVIALGLGVLVAAAALVTAPVAAVVSRMIWRPGWISVPYGLVLALASTVSLMLVARSVSRRHAIAAAIAWLVGLGLVVKGTSGGSFIIADDALGWSFIMLGTIAALVPALWGATVLGASPRGGSRR